MKIGQYIALQRKKSGLSQRQIAPLMGLDQATISRKEAGRAAWEWGQVELFCKIISTTLTEFCRGYENQK